MKARTRQIGRAEVKPVEDEMHDEPTGSMSVENVEEFDVWIFDSRDLVVSVVPHHDPLRAATEKYEISEP